MQFKQRKETLPAPVVTASDMVRESLPARARFFDACRTRAVVFHGFAEYDEVRFHVAVCTDRDAELWRIMSYSFLDAGNPEDTFTASVAKDGLTFPQAMMQIAQLEMLLDNAFKHEDFTPFEAYDLNGDRFPPEEYPALKQHYFDVNHYVDTCHVEGISFDQRGRPHGRRAGLVVTNASFKASELSLAFSRAAQPAGEGVLDEMLRAVIAGRNGEETLKALEVVTEMDMVVGDIAVAYAALESLAAGNPNPDFGFLLCLENTARQRLAADAAAMAEKYLAGGDSPVTRAYGRLKGMAAKGIFTDDVEMVVAQCEVSLLVQRGAKVAEALKQSFATAADREKVLEDFAAVRRLAEQADEALRARGFPQRVSAEDVRTRLIPDFMQRYYAKRRDFAQGLDEKRAPSTAFVRKM